MRKIDVGIHAKITPARYQLDCGHSPRASSMSAQVAKNNEIQLTRTSDGPAGSVVTSANT